RDRRPQPGSRRARELGRGLLAEAAEEVGGALEIAARGRMGEREQPDREADHERVDPRLEDRDPGRHAQDRVHGAVVDAAGAREAPPWRAGQGAAGPSTPPAPATSGSASRRRPRSSPMSNPRRASSPTTKKKKVISPLLTQPRRSWERTAPPARISRRARH